MRMVCRGQARELRACVRGRAERAALRLRYARARGGRANPNPYPSPSTGGWHARLSTQAPHLVAARGERLVEEDGEVRVLPGGKTRVPEMGGRGASDGGWQWRRRWRRCRRGSGEATRARGAPDPSLATAPVDKPGRAQAGMMMNWQVAWSWCGGAPSSGGRGPHNRESTPQVILRPPPQTDGCCIAHRTWRCLDGGGVSGAGAVRFGEFSAVGGVKKMDDIG